MARKSMRRSRASRRAGSRRSRAGSRRAGARRSRYGGQIMHQLPTPFNPNNATPGQIQFANAYAAAVAAPFKAAVAANNFGFGGLEQEIINQNPELRMTGSDVMNNFATYGNAADGFPSLNSNDFANSVGRPDANALLANPNNPAYSNYISMLQHPDS